MSKRLFFMVAIFVGLLIISSASFAAGPFYEGKTVRIIVGFSPGGGFDIYARVLARHIGKYTPGHPTFIVENMGGAGSLILANHLYRVAKPDGLTIGHFSGVLFFNQILGQPGIDFNAQKFLYIGAIAKQENVIVFTKASGITSIEKWMASRTPAKFGSTAPGDGTSNVPRILRAALGLPIQIISGYKGVSEIRLAMETGEVAAGSWGWDALRASWSTHLQTGDAVVVLQAVPKSIADLPNVPMAITLAKTEEARQLIEIGIHSNINIARPFVLPPGTPKEQKEILSKALQETLKDNEFVSELKKSKLDLNPVPGEEIEKAVNNLFNQESGLIAKLKDIIFK